MDDPQKLHAWIKDVTRSSSSSKGERIDIEGSAGGGGARVAADEGERYRANSKPDKPVDYDKIRPPGQAPKSKGMGTVVKVLVLMLVLGGGGFFAYQQSAGGTAGGGTKPAEPAGEEAATVAEAEAGAGVEAPEAAAGGAAATGVAGDSGAEQAAQAAQAPDLTAGDFNKALLALEIMFKDAKKHGHALRIQELAKLEEKQLAALLKWKTTRGKNAEQLAVELSKLPFMLRYLTLDKIHGAAVPPPARVLTHPVCGTAMTTSHSC